MYDIKIFDFDFLEGININQLKTKIGLEKLHLNLIKILNYLFLSKFSMKNHPDKSICWSG